MAVDVTGVLRRTDLLRSLSERDLAALAAASRSRRFRRGQIVCTAGEPGDSLIVVITGRLKIVVRSADGGELTLAVIGPGSVLGEVSIADGGPRSADAEALDDSQVILIPRDTLTDLCGRSPSAAVALARSIAATLRRLTDATSDLVFLDLPRRAAKVLLAQPRDSAGVIRPPLTQEELARQAGGTRQSINAILRGFEKRGWIAVQGREVTVRQPVPLARFGGDHMSAS